MPSTVLTSKGQITLPVEIRKEMGHKAVDRLDFTPTAALPYLENGRVARTRQPLTFKLRNSPTCNDCPDSAAFHPTVCCLRIVNGGYQMLKDCDVKLTARGPKGAWTHMLIPFDAAEAFGRRGLIPVAGTINGFAFRSSLSPERNGRHYLMANKAMLAGAKAAAGDTVHLILELDQTERTVALPAELQVALEADRVAAGIFAALSYSCRKEYAVWIDGAKKQETREGRARKALVMLVEGKRTPNP